MALANLFLRLIERSSTMAEATRNFEQSQIYCIHSKISPSSMKCAAKCLPNSGSLMDVRTPAFWNFPCEPLFLDALFLFPLPVHFPTYPFDRNLMFATFPPTSFVLPRCLVLACLVALLRHSAIRSCLPKNWTMVRLAWSVGDSLASATTSGTQ